MALILASIVENASFTSYSVCSGTFVKSATENINFLDAPLGFAWVKIDNTEGTTWTLVDNRQ